MGKVIIEKFNSVFCPHCAAKNPKKAYVCLKCFKVMFSRDEKIAWWKIKVHPVISFAIILSIVVYSVLSFVGHWLTAVEGNLTLSVKTNNYNLNVMADKKRNEPLEKEVILKNITSESTPPSDLE